MWTGPGPTRSSSNTTRSAYQPSAIATAVADAVEARLHVGEEVHGLLERQELVGPTRREQRRRVAERRQHVEVRAGVGRADDDTRVAPRLGPQSPRLRVVAPRRRHEHRAELVGDDDVEHRVERVGAALGGDVGDGAAREALVLGRKGLADLEPVPAQHGAEQAGVGLGGLSLRRRRTSGSARARIFSSSGSAIVGPQPGSASKRNPDRKLRWSCITAGTDEREDAAALLGGAIGRRELVAVRVTPGPDDEHVPVQRPPRCRRHRGHERDVLVGERPDRRDELERRAGMVADDA